MAEHFAELMRLLGYRHYCAQGGDWGAIITSELAARCRLGRGNGAGVPPFCAARHPESCVALHVFLGVLESWLDVSICFLESMNLRNMCVGRQVPSTVPDLLKAILTIPFWTKELNNGWKWADGGG